VLEFRDVLLFLLFYTVLRQRRNYRYAVIAGGFVMLPLLVSGGSGFAKPIQLLFVALLAESRVLSSSLKQHPSRVAGTAAIACLLFAMAVAWNGAMKPYWRGRIQSRELSGPILGQIQSFLTEAPQQLGTMQLSDGVWHTTKRVSDVPVMFGLVMDRVPNKVAHTDGELTQRAVKHVFMPRFLFPSKQSLGSDSTLVERFAGLQVAGEEQGTSIGMGYLIEFYVDFGLLGFVVGPFVVGFIVGVAVRAIALVAPSRSMYFGTIVAILLQHYMSLDGNLAKMIGGLIMAFAVQGAMLRFAGRELDAMLQMRSPRQYSVPVYN
jgi:hypothetical protein